MALQRTFSGFPSGWPGCALLLLRAVVGGSAVLQGAWFILTVQRAAVGPLAAGLTILVGAALIIGLATPIATALLCLGGIFIAVEPAVIRDPTLFQSWFSRLEFIVMSAVLIPLGPGAISLDARLYGRREFDMNRGDR